MLESGQLGARDRDRILELLRDVNSVFDVFQVDSEQLDDAAIRRLIREREEARLNKDYERSDEIRDQLSEQGILLEDTREGTRWKRRG